MAVTPRSEIGPVLITLLWVAPNHWLQLSLVALRIGLSSARTFRAVWGGVKAHFRAENTCENGYLHPSYSISYSLKSALFFIALKKGLDHLSKTYLAVIPLKLP